MIFRLRMANTSVRIPTECFQGHVTSLKFWLISGNIFEKIHDGDIDKWSNRRVLHSALPRETHV